MVGVCIYLNDESADVVVLWDRGTVRLAVTEPGSVVIDLSDFEHHQTTARLAASDPPHARHACPPHIF